MGLIDLLECSLRELRRRKLRAAAAVLGYALAAAVLIVTSGALRCARRQSDDVLRSTGTHFVAYSPADAPACDACRAVARTGGDEGLVVYGGPTNLISSRAVAAIRSLPSVRDASPYLLFRFRDPVDGTTFGVGGYDPRSDAAVGPTCCAPSDIIDGRFPAPGEDGLAVLEEAYAARKGIRAGGSISILGQTLPVIGVVNPGIRPGKADVYVHLADARKLVERRIGPGMLFDDTNMILIEVKSSQLQEEAMKAVKGLFPGIVISSYACYRPAAQVMGMNEAAAWTLTAVVVLFAVAFALKSQLASVIERRREVAILKSIGWPDGSIVRQILVESGLQALLGSAAGCIFAAAILLAVPARLFTGAGGREAVGAWWPAFPGAVLLVLIGGAIAGAVPALVAARQSPAEGLRKV